MEINQLPVEPKVAPQSEPVVDPVKEPVANEQESLSERIAKFTQENQVKEEIPEDFTFNSKEIENITDPVAREYAEKAHKSYQKEFNKKFQEIADLRKSMENSLHKSPSETEWTPERVQALTQDPKFLQAAQQVASQTDNSQSEEYSALTDEEQAEIRALKSEIAQMKQGQSKQMIAQQDETLASTYSNYNPQAVDTLTADLISGKAQADRSSLWKVIDYDDNAKRAYELGRLDERSGVQEKAQSLSMEGSQVVKTPVDLTKEDGQTSKQHWRNIMSQVLTNNKSNAAIKS